MRNKKNNRALLTEAFRQYEEGRDYKRRAGLYDTVSINERFYRGDQWKDVNTESLPAPVFNIIRRIVSYLVSQVASCRIGILYGSDGVPGGSNAGDALAILNTAASYCWEKNKIDSLLRDSLHDAAISGDAVFYSYFDPSFYGSGPYNGDIRVKLIDSTDLYVADVHEQNVQEQDYIIISGRSSVRSLRKEAEKYGLSADEIKKIVPDGTGSESGAGDWSSVSKDTSSETEKKATYLIRFSRDGEGFVLWEKCTESVVIRRVQTRMKMYPLAMYSWEKVKNRFYGSSPVTELIANQKYINKAFAMAMKHMTDTAFSKVIYDKKLIPEWSNAVGEAIGVVSGGDISNVVTNLGVGKMEEGFLDLIKLTIENTKEVSGATDVALGEASPNNTSAIIALQEASNIPLENIRANLYAAIEDLASIWAEMFCEYYPDGRPVGRDGESAKFSTLRDVFISARTDIADYSTTNSATVVNILDKLLDGGHITLREYLDRLPAGLLPEKDSIVGKLAESAEAEDKPEEDEPAKEAYEQPEITHSERNDQDG